MPQIVKNIVSSYLARSTAILGDFIVFPILSFYLGMEALGAWFLIRNAVTLVLRSDLGIGAATTRYVAVAAAHGDPTAMSKAVNTANRFLVFIGSAAAVAFTIGAKFVWNGMQGGDWNSDVQRSVLIVAIGSLFIGLPLSNYRRILAGLQRYDIVNTLSTVEILIRSILFALVVYVKPSITNLATIESLLFVLFSGIAYRYCTKLQLHTRVRIVDCDWSLLKSMLPYSLQLSALSILGYIILQTDYLVIGTFLSISLVAMYAAGYKLYLGCRELTAAMVQPFFAEGAHSSAIGHRERIQETLRSGTKIGLALSLIGTIPIIAFADQILGFWVGKDYLGATNTTRILLIGLLVSNIHLVAGALLRGAGKTGVYLLLHIVWAISNIGLSIILGRQFGLVGVAWGTVLPILILEPFYVWNALVEFQIPARRFIHDAIVLPAILAIGALIPMISAMALIPEHTGLLSVAIPSVVYGLAYSYLFFKFGMSDKERRFANTLKARVLINRLGMAKST